MSSTEIFLAGLLFEGGLGLLAIGGMFFQTRMNTRAIGELKTADTQLLGQLTTHMKDETDHRDADRLLREQQGVSIAKMEGYLIGHAEVHGMKPAEPR